MVKRRSKRTQDKRKKAKVGNTIIVDRKALIGALRKAHLGGLIPELAVSFKKGYISIEAVDAANVVASIIRQKVYRPRNISMEVGFGNVELLIKFLGSLGSKKLDLMFTDEMDRMVVCREDRRRKLNYLLTDFEMIISRILSSKGDPIDPYEHTKKLMRFKVVLTETIIKDTLSFLAFFKEKGNTIVLTVSNGVVRFTCGAKEAHMADLILSNELMDSETDDPCDDDDFEMTVDGEYFSRVLSVIDYVKDEPPVLFIGDGSKGPIMIENAGSAWAMVPTAETDISDEDLSNQDQEDDDDVPF